MLQKTQNLHIFILCKHTDGPYKGVPKPERKLIAPQTKEQQYIKNQTLQRHFMIQCHTASCLSLSQNQFHNLR